MVSSLQGTLASDMAPDFQNLVHQNPQTMLNCLMDAVHSADLATLQGSVRAAIKHEQLPPEEFLHRISESQQIDVLRGCLLVHILSLSTKVLREFQLEAILGPLDGRDAVVSLATGS